MTEPRTLHPVLSPVKVGGVVLRPVEGESVVVALTAREAAGLSAIGAIGEPLPAAGEPEGEARAAALAAVIPSLQIGDFTRGGQLTAEAKRRLAQSLGFLPDEAELRAAAEAFATQRDADASA